MDLPSRSHTSCLHARTPVEDDHDVLAKGFLVALEPDAQALRGCNHQRDGNDSPRDTEHRQEGAEFVRPERVNRVFEQVYEVHFPIAARVAILSRASRCLASRGGSRRDAESNHPCSDSLTGRSIYCKITFCPSFSPDMISAFTALEIPTLTGTLRRPESAFGSGTSTETFLSLSKISAPSGASSTFFFSSRMISAFALMLARNSPVGF